MAEVKYYDKVSFHHKTQLQLHFCIFDQHQTNLVVYNKEKQLLMSGIVGSLNMGK